jgi:8-oxo-dGTP pyrophosphatase MutT (NUDIX family)
MSLGHFWNGHTWTFSAGKINQVECGVEAAAGRETYEETGFAYLFGYVVERVE